jgi:putative flippase GtrA
VGAGSEGLVRVPPDDSGPASAVARPAARGLGGRLRAPLHRDAWLKSLQARRFVVVGMLNTLVDYVLFIGLTKLLHLPLDRVWIAKVMSGTVAITISFLLNRRWVFGARGGAPVHHQAARFLAATAVGVYGIQAPLTQLLARNHQWPGRALYAVLRDLGLAQTAPSVFTEALATKTAAFALATCCSMVFNFFAYRYWVFRERSAS